MTTLLLADRREVRPAVEALRDLRVQLRASGGAATQAGQKQPEPGRLLSGDRSAPSAHSDPRNELPKAADAAFGLCGAATVAAMAADARRGTETTASEAEAGWQSVRLDEIEPIPVLDGTLLWRPVRRTLDIGAFGINSYIAPAAGNDVVEEHTEESLGHEEIYVVLSGRARFHLDDETLDAPAGTVVFVRDPKVKRHAVAEEPNTSVLAVGGPRDAAYEPSQLPFYPGTGELG